VVGVTIAVVMLLQGAQTHIHIRRDRHTRADTHTRTYKQAHAITLLHTQPHTYIDAHKDTRDRYDYDELPLSVSLSFKHAHVPLSLSHTSVCVCVFVGALGVLSNRLWYPGKPTVWWPDRVHGLLGLGVSVLAACNCFLGVAVVYNGGGADGFSYNLVPVAAIALLVTWAAATVIAVLILECTSGKKEVPCVCMYKYVCV
jgi:hypothetical protein